MHVYFTLHYERNINFVLLHSKNPTFENVLLQEVFDSQINNVNSHRKLNLMSVSLFLSMTMRYLCVKCNASYCKSIGDPENYQNSNALDVTWCIEFCSVSLSSFFFFLVCTVKYLALLHITESNLKVIFQVNFHGHASFYIYIPYKVV